MKKKYFFIIMIIGIFIASILYKFPVYKTGPINNSNTENISYTNRDSLSRNGKFTKIKGNGTDIVTIMIYICGSNLESEGSAASADINEILSAQLGENVNVIIQTGGAIKWHTDGISPNSVKRFAVVNNKLEPIDDIGNADILSSDSLSDFISFSAENYSADRYGLILWNHGSGALYGFGSDENNPKSVLTIDKIDKALSDAGVKFDFIGFDACIMANFETAIMLSRHADYLIASEEIEPSSGWYYTDFLNQLSEYPSMDTVQIAKNIIDYYIFTARISDSFNDYTLSVIDLEKLSTDTYPLFCSFFESLTEKLSAGEYDKIAHARAKSLEFAFSEYGHIDLMDFVSLVDDGYSQPLMESISSSVEYHKETPDFKNANGLTLYFPYKYIDGWEKMLKIYKTLNFGNEYCDFISYFLSIMAGGKTDRTAAASQLNETHTVKQYWENFSWFNSNAVNKYSAYYIKPQHSEFQSGIHIEQNDNYYIIKISDSLKKIINSIKPEFYIYNGENYINIGSDSCINIAADGSISIENDCRQLTLNGINAPFYRAYEHHSGKKMKYGFVPAVINNDKNIDIMVYHDSEFDEWRVAGYRIKSYDDFSLPAERGLNKFKKGDCIEFLCKCYNSDGEYIGEELINKLYINDDSEIKVCYKHIENSNICVYFIFSDIYNNIFSIKY